MFFLTQDSLKGRKNFGPELNTCASYIAQKFEQMGLKQSIALKSYYQAFSPLQDISRIKTLDSLFLNSHAVLFNLIGIIPGKSKANEIILFSAHYDHVGADSSLKNDKIFNGANDNASGTAALLSLAKYYSLKNDNERTLAFCAFSGEELGLIGSKFFATTTILKNVKAVINIEMIGRPTVGKNAFFITGADRSNLFSIIRKNIPKGFAKIVSEPPIERNLFKRSDNYSFALKGVIAHTIMSSYDNDECYHKPCDEITRINFDHMVQIVKTLAISLQPIIKGDETPVEKLSLY